MPKELKKELMKTIALSTLFISAIVIFFVVNQNFENKFNREMKLPDFSQGSQ